MAGSSVVGLGAGVIIILVLWTLTAIAWVQLTDAQSGLRIFITILSFLVTVSLLLTPVDDGIVQNPEMFPDQMKPEDYLPVYDYLFIWKAILIALMICSIIGSVIVYLKAFWSVKIHGSEPLSRIPLYSQESIPGL